MPTVPVLDGKGKKQESLDLRADVFPDTVRVPLIHQAVVKELAARRAGTHDTKGRSEVAGVDGLGVTDGKTKTLMGRLKGLGLPVAPTLLVVSERTDALGRAARNVPWLAVETPAHASVYQVMRHERVVFEKAA